MNLINNYDITLMFIKIDCREKDLVKACHERITSDNGKLFKDIKIVTDQLSLGDIAICNNTNDVQVLVERKTLNDLAASITDGRYLEQSFRLNNCDIDNHDIIYLIEGNLQNYAPRPGGIPRTTLISSMVSINNGKRFSLYKTNTTEESAEWLLCFAKKIIKKNQSSSNSNINQNYVVVAKKAKKDSITKDNIEQIMLAQVPGVSSSIAKAVMERYGSLYNLLGALSGNIHELYDITITTSSGKERKIAKTAINNMKHFLIKENINK